MISQQAQHLIHWLEVFAKDHIDSFLIDERHCIPPPIILAFGNQGLFGLRIPQEFGGLGLSYHDTFAIIEYLAKIDLTLASLVSFHNLTLDFIAPYIPPTLGPEIISRCATGRTLCVMALTEKNTDFDSQAIETLAIEQSDGQWLISGEKQWVGFAEWSDYICLFARTQDRHGQEKGISGFLVPADSPGLSFSSEFLTIGLRGMNQNSIKLERVIVPQPNILGEIGLGLPLIDGALNHLRISFCALSLGTMKNCLNILERYGSQEYPAAGKLMDHAIGLTKVFEIQCFIQALQIFFKMITQKMDASFPAPNEIAAAAKVLATEFLWQTIDHFIQLLGGLGCVENNLASCLMRNARVMRIFEGINELLISFIGSSLLSQRDFLNRDLDAFFDVEQVAQHLWPLLEPYQNLDQASPLEKEETEQMIGNIFLDWLIYAALQIDSDPSTSLTQAFFEERLASHLALLDKIHSSESWEKIYQSLFSFSSQLGEPILAHLETINLSLDPLLKEIFKHPWKLVARTTIQETSSVSSFLGEPAELVELTGDQLNSFLSSYLLGGYKEDTFFIQSLEGTASDMKGILSFSHYFIAGDGVFHISMLMFEYFAFQFVSLYCSLFLGQDSFNQADMEEMTINFKKAINKTEDVHFQVKINPIQAEGKGKYVFRFNLEDSSFVAMLSVRIEGKPRLIQHTHWTAHEVQGLIPSYLKELNKDLNYQMDKIEVGANQAYLEVAYQIDLKPPPASFYQLNMLRTICMSQLGVIAASWAAGFTSKPGEVYLIDWKMTYDQEKGVNSTLKERIDAKLIKKIPLEENRYYIISSLMIDQTTIYVKNGVIV